MKKVLAALLACAVAIQASALIEGNGYYRVQNAKTERYIYVLDDKGSLNFQATTAELGAMQLWKGFEKTVTDPATIIYLVDLTGENRDFDLQSQGTGVKAIIDYPVSIRLADKTNGTYSIFGRNSGLTRYIGDGTRSTNDRGYLTSLENGEYYRWRFMPVNTADNFFGVQPDFEVDGKYYTTLYVDFPFAFHSAGMKAYGVCAVEKGRVHIKEIDGAVAKGTPVIIECSSAAPSANKLNIGAQANPVDENLLKGVYFCNDDDVIHYNFVEYDKKTMRVLGRLSDGSIGFTTATLKYLPRNKAYITVPENTPEELPLTTDKPGSVSDMQQDVSVRVSGDRLFVTGVTEVRVYNLSGTEVAAAAGSPADAVSVTLPAPGIYLVKADGVATKIVVR